MAHCGAHHRQSRIIFHGCKGSVQWYCGRETVTGTSNNGCTFCLRSSCYTGLTGLLEEQPVREMKNGHGRCSCRIKQIYVTSSFVRLVLHQLTFINLSIGESFFFFFFFFLIYSNISFQSFLSFRSLLYRKDLWKLIKKPVQFQKFWKTNFNYCNGV